MDEVAQDRISPSGPVPPLLYVHLHLNDVSLSSERRTSKAWGPANKATHFAGTLDRRAGFSTFRYWRFEIRGPRLCGVV
jgi:hypothetical protein